MLLNLLSNAVKYNSAAGTIRISVLGTRDRRVRLNISDTGAGIPEERQHELFEPFNRLDADSSSQEGSGLGLTLTKSLVEAMGGLIGVESTVGEGSCFYVEFPLASEEERGEEHEGDLTAEAAPSTPNG